MTYALSASAQYLAVAATSAKFTSAMAPGKLYRYVCAANSWVKVTATGGAAAADTANNHYIPANTAVLLRNPDTSITTNAFVHAIRDTADGDATLSEVVGGV